MGSGGSGSLLFLLLRLPLFIGHLHGLFARHGISGAQACANPLLLLPFTDFQKALFVKDEVTMAVSAHLPNFRVNQGRDRAGFHAQATKAAEVVVNDEDDRILALVPWLFVNGFNVDAVVGANAFASEAADAIFFARASVNGEPDGAPIAQGDGARAPLFGDRDSLPLDDDAPKVFARHS